MARSASQLENDVANFKAEGSLYEAPCCVWDFTSFIEDQHPLVIEKLREHCKKWTFQEEQCPTTGRLHWQGRLSLGRKRRENVVRQLFPGWHLTKTATCNRNNDFYVVKEETRINGPWSDETSVPEFEVPWQLEDMVSLRPWQQHIVDDASPSRRDRRTVNVIVDPVGNHGKTMLKMYILVYGIGRFLPFCNDFRDICRMVMNTQKMPLYIIDIPRALRKDQLYQFFSGVETLKDGYCFDDRYHFKEAVFGTPNIWIFMNMMPDTALLSRDRWRIWWFSEDGLSITRDAPPEETLSTDDAT